MYFCVVIQYNPHENQKSHHQPHPTRPQTQPTRHWPRQHWASSRGEAPLGTPEHRL